MASGLENEFVALHEIVKAAKIRLNANIWDYLIGGTETETTLRRNRMALDSIAFRPRVLRNVSKIDPSSEILGKKIRLPVMLAPVGSLESFEPGGGITVARGAGAGNVAMLISSVTTLKLEPAPPRLGPMVAITATVKATITPSTSHCAQLSIVASATTQRAMPMISASTV